MDHHLQFFLALLVYHFYYDASLQCCRREGFIDPQPCYGDLGAVSSYHDLWISKPGINLPRPKPSMRKTFGFHFYQNTKDVKVLQELFNQSAPSVTLRYIGISQGIMDSAIDDFSL